MRNRRHLIQRRADVGGDAAFTYPKGWWVEEETALFCLAPRTKAGSLSKFGSVRPELTTERMNFCSIYRPPHDPKGMAGIHVPPCTAQAGGLVAITSGIQRTGEQRDRQRTPSLTTRHKILGVLDGLCWEESQKDMDEKSQRIRKRLRR